MRHPAVAEAAAVGVPSELGEDDILLIVTLRPGAALDYAELLDFCAARMPYFCVRDSSRLSTSSRRTSSDGYVKTYCAPGSQSGRVGSRKTRLYR